ncbi:anaerobic ribonucleoside-triphosphate reductase [uncultured Faecalibaculum sp.]|uniref:anaerobic ribonucleoside-triphosphate reductase n=1 Tax=uncultured Faecalibaculum sp. TaxID=1729681 RepID=UPI002615F53B|nr:anaerobic ribonucleoside-triphosphate reductase [uncultured Faecalibaculum sp.]
MNWLVVKRDGTEVPFDMEKIVTAIRKSFASLGPVPDDSILQLLALRVSADFSLVMDNGHISVEQIQDSAERILSMAGYADAAKAYILYRKQREHVRALQDSSSRYAQLTKAYLDQPEAAGNRETDAVYSLGGLILSNSGEVTQHYWLASIFDEQAVKAHREGWLHIHDLDMLAGGSAGWDIRRLIEKGLYVEGQIAARPARHLNALCAQLVNFVTIMQNEWSGAQSLSHFDTCLAPFVKKDGLSMDEVKSAMETFIFGVNTPSRWGTQPAFSNVVFDMTVPEEWKNLVADRETGLRYADCSREMEMIRKAFFSVLQEGDVQGRGFPFPIPVIRISDTLPQDPEIFSAAAKYGNPVFARNQSPMEGFFSWEGGKTSLGAVTLNLPHLAWDSPDEPAFFARLDELCELAARILDTRRQVVRQFFDNGLYPCTRGYLDDLQQGYCSIGVIGMNEACLNASFISGDLTSGEGQAFAQRVLAHLRAFTDSREHFVLMATPAEGVAQRLAQLDVKNCTGIRTAGTPDAPYYTNSCQLAVNATDDLYGTVRIQEQLQPYFSGGSFLSIPFTRPVSGEELKMLEHRLQSRTSIPVFAFTPVWSVCPEHGYQPGSHSLCPVCHQPAEVWIRVSGYYRPFSQVNKAKQQEFLERKPYII